MNYDSNFYKEKFANVMLDTGEMVLHEWSADSFSHLYLPKYRNSN